VHGCFAGAENAPGADVYKFCLNEDKINLQFVSSFYVKVIYLCWKIWNSNILCISINLRTANFSQFIDYQNNTK